MSVCYLFLKKFFCVIYQEQFLRNIQFICFPSGLSSLLLILTFFLDCLSMLRCNISLNLQPKESYFYQVSVTKFVFAKNPECMHLVTIFHMNY